MNILVPIDGETLSLAAVHFVIALAQQGLQCRVLLVNVQEAASLYERRMVDNNPEILKNVIEGAGKHALEGARKLLGKAGIEHAEEVATGGSPASELLSLADAHNVDMIVIAAHGKGWLRTLLQGSVASTLLQDATIPVTVLKPDMSAQD